MLNITPVYDNSKPAPWYARVYDADTLGRQLNNCYDQFRTRKAACAHWWMLARQGVVAFLPNENMVGMTNARLTKDQEPADLKEVIDYCEQVYLKEAENHSEAVDFARANSIFNATRI